MNISKDLLYSIWNSSHCYVAAWMGEGFGGELFFVQSLSHVRLFATLWTVAHQASLSMGFSRQEYWSGLLFPSPGGLANPGIEFFTTSTTWEAQVPGYE